jgi:hypothetical protein
MHPTLSRLFATAEDNLTRSRHITDGQRALVEKLTREGNDVTIARALLRAAQATEETFKAHRDQLKRLTLATRIDDSSLTSGLHRLDVRAVLAMKFGSVRDDARSRVIGPP